MNRRSLLVGLTGLAAALFTGTAVSEGKEQSPERVCVRLGHETEPVCESSGGSVSFCDRRILECVRCHVLILRPIS